MDYLTKYYKNLSEQLQEQINVLENLLNEAGFKRAMRSNDPDKQRKEIARQAARGAYHPNWALNDEDIIAKIGEKKYTSRKKRGENIDALQGELEKNNSGELDQYETDEIIFTIRDQANRNKYEPYPTPSEMTKEMMAGTRVTKTQRPYRTPSEMAAEMMAGTRDMTADRHDGPDPDTTATADEVEASQKAKQLGEATMSKATRLGKKYPGTVDRAVSAQKRRLPKKQEHRDALRSEAENEAAAEYGAAARGKDYASGSDAEMWWRESRGENPRYGVGKANERVQDVLGNLAKLSILNFLGYRKAKKKK